MDAPGFSMKDCQEKCLKTKGCVAIDYVWLVLEVVAHGWCRMYGRTHNVSDPIVAGRKYCELAGEINPIGTDIIQCIN